MNASLLMRRSGLRFPRLFAAPLLLLLAAACGAPQDPPARPRTGSAAPRPAVQSTAQRANPSQMLGVAVRNGVGGVAIIGMDLDGPAASAGALVGDFITAVNGIGVASEQELAGALAAAAGAGHVTLELWRQGEPREAAIAVQAAQDEPATPLGLQVRELPEATLRSLGVAYGVMVTKVRGAATRSRLLPGDVIVAVNRSSIHSLEEFNRLLAAAQNGVVSLLVRRADADLYIPLDGRAGPPAATGTPLRT
ncbi:MAG TPA: PDZ domain-containing protein [Burkholderiales bacterium]|nr:PDZ domain-containing protein [Burkholderiales bacterium]